jgi:hypothetical protein
MRLRWISRVFAAWAMALAAACAPSARSGTDPTPATNAPPASSAGGARTITLAALTASLAPKTEAIRSVHPAVSYGDSDGDIADTHAADPAIRAIRVIRSPVSYNERPFQPGKYGEEILANSAD